MSIALKIFKSVYFLLSCNGKYQNLVNKLFFCYGNSHNGATENVKVQFLLWRRRYKKNLRMNKIVRTKMRPKKGTKIELQREIWQILSDLLKLQV